MTRSPVSRHTEPHVISYLWIRRAVGGLGLALPIILGPVGYLLFGIEIQENMSCYYHTPLRDVFVGVLCAIGLFMFCYVGSSQLENWTGNFGCLAAIGVAWCPIDANSDPLHQSTYLGYVHMLCGGLLFTCMGLFSIYHFPSNEPEDQTGAWDTGRRVLFLLTGIVLFASILAMAVFLFVLDRETREELSAWNIIFWGEWIALWAFATSWLVKGRVLAALLESGEMIKSFRPGKPRG